MHITVKYNAIQISFGFILVLCIWAIFAYGAQIVPLIPIVPFGSKQANINNVLLNLSYSYLAGCLFYLLTVLLPRMRNTVIVKKAIKLKLDIIKNIILNILLEFSLDRNMQTIDLSDIDSCKAILSSRAWTSPVKSMQEIRGIEMNYLHFTYLQQQDIIHQTNEIITHYKEHLSVDQLMSLEMLKNEQIFKTVCNFVTIPNMQMTEKGGIESMANWFCGMLIRFNSIYDAFK
jgi:hypothetical protein